MSKPVIRNGWLLSMHDEAGQKLQSMAEPSSIFASMVGGTIVG